MSIIKKHIDTVKSMINEAFKDQSFNYTDSYIGTILIAVRNQLTKQFLDKGNKLSDSSKQFLCVSLVRSTLDNCNCTDVTLCGLKTYRSTVKINPLEYTGTSTYSVLNLALEPINTISPSQIKYAQYAPIEIEQGYFFNDGYLYLYSNYPIEKVLFKGVTIGAEAINCETCSLSSNSSVCAYNEELNGFIEPVLESALWQLSYNLITGKSNEDKLNNLVDETVQK